MINLKTCRDCVHYAKCLENYNTYHVSTLTPDNDVTDRCNQFEDKAIKNITFCKDWKHLHLILSDCYAECGKGYKGIVSIDDFCDKGGLRWKFVEIANNIPNV